MKYLPKKILPWLLATLGLATLAVVAHAAFFASPAGPALITAPVVRADLTDSVLATGELDAYELVSVGAQASGQVKTLYVAVGDRVKKGQLIAEIDSLTQQNTLKTAKAVLRSVQAQLQAKRATLRQQEAALARQKMLLKGDAGSREDYETAWANRDVTRAEIAALEAQIEESQVDVSTAEVNLGYTRITAPMDGVVVAVITKQGQTVNAAQSAPTIIKLAQLDTMTVNAEISEADVVRVRPGQKVYFTILGEPDHRYEATLRTIKPAPESVETDSTSSSSSSTSSSSSAIYYIGQFDVPNPEGKLRINMTAQCTIIVSAAPDAVCIPSTALGAKGPDGAYTVQVVGPEGQAQTKSVRVGISDHTRVQVLAGLQPGERVIVGQALAAGEETSQNGRRRGPPMGL
ncbi:MAG: efflux RND transporter periplasmic adaptor subunit [Deltaproteobacteria bacterium]|nr:efflux RND transporter periplasmic adaptor subunit [Deltaproteobacteria bacterium]